jgi:hypothetical protein
MEMPLKKARSIGAGIPLARVSDSIRAFIHAEAIAGNRTHKHIKVYLYIEKCVVNRILHGATVATGKTGGGHPATFKTNLQPILKRMFIVHLHHFKPGQNRPGEACTKRSARG